MYLISPVLLPDTSLKRWMYWWTMEKSAQGKKKTPHILKSAWADISGGHYRVCKTCLLELFCLFRGGVGGVGVGAGGRRQEEKNCLLLVVLYCFQFSQRFEVTFSCFSSNTAAKYNVLGSAWHNRKVLPSYASKKILRHIFRNFDKIIQKRVCKKKTAKLHFKPTATTCSLLVFFKLIRKWN